MTMRTAPAASGVYALWSNPLTATVKTRKNVPITSTAYFRVAAAHRASCHWETATITDGRSLVMTSAIALSLLRRLGFPYAVDNSASEDRRHRGHRPLARLATRTNRMPATCKPGRRSAAEDLLDPAGGQLGLRQESGHRALGDQLRVVGFGPRGDHDHVGLRAVMGLGEEPGEVEPALLPETDVDEDDVGPKRPNLPECLGRIRRHAEDRHALSLQQNARRIEKGLVVVDEHALQGHQIMVSGAGRGRLAANGKSADGLSGLEEPEDREHPPMISSALRQVELGEDAADMLLDRALGHDDPAGDAGIGRAFGHQGEYLVLARRKRIERITPPPGLH